MPQTLTNFDAVLKNIYLGPVREQLNNATILLRKLKRDTENVSGRKWIFPLHYGRNFGGGSRPDNAALAEAGHQSYKEAEEVLKYHYGRIRVTGPTMKASRNNAGAFIRAVDSEIKGCARDKKKDLNRQFLGDGTAALTVCGSTSGSTTVNVVSTKYIKPGMKVDIRNSTTGAAIANGDSVEVLTVPNSTTFTVGDAVTTTNAHSVYFEDNAGASGGALVSYETNGLRNIIAASGTLHNVDPSTYAWWVANVDSSTTTLDVEEGQAILDAIDEDDGECNLILTSYKMRREFIKLGVADTRFISDGSTAKARIGMKDPTFNDIAIQVDPDIYNDYIYFLDTGELWIAQAGDWDWMDDDGAILHMVSGYDAYEAVLYWYSNLVTKKRSSHGVMTAVTTSAG
jgi:hypothetical protein